MEIEKQVLIVAKAVCECFTICDPQDAERETERAKKSYADELNMLNGYLKDYPKTNWQPQIEHTEKILSGEIAPMTWEEFGKLQRDYWLSKEAQEITEEQFEYALNVLPPLNWKNYEDYSTFFMQEFMTSTFTEQYYHDKRSGKYYCALVDICDKSTWIDKLLQSPLMSL